MPESVTISVTELFATGACGMPEIAPTPDNVKPAGRDPLVADHR